MPDTCILDAGEVCEDHIMSGEMRCLVRHCGGQTVMLASGQLAPCGSVGVSLSETQFDVTKLLGTVSFLILMFMLPSGEHAVKFFHRWAGILENRGQDMPATWPFLFPSRNPSTRDIQAASSPCVD